MKKKILFSVVLAFFKATIFFAQDIASEQRAKVVYEYLYRQIDDKYVRETIDFEQRM